MNILLNDVQKAAVNHPDGPALVLAGAGSGKTRVIIERLAWLVEERGVDPRNLLALTFTNRAAGEMGRRFAERIHRPKVTSWLGTFHAFGLMVLRREIHHLNREREFNVIDAADQLSIMKRLVKEMPAKFEKVSPKDTLNKISRMKQDVHTLTAANGRGDEESYVYLWNMYHEVLQKESLVDFDDLLVLLITLFEEHPEVCKRYQERYRHVLLDEYQDTNHAQYCIARMLSEKHGNIFAVGDEDQSIYSWRGADINNILDFARDFPNAVVYRLEQNYRSSGHILSAANAVVKNNLNRLGKTLWTQAEMGEQVRFYLAENADMEAHFVAEDITSRKLPPQETAILYRTNAQSRALEVALLRKGINYTVVGGVKFYQRREIKDIIAYLRLMVNPKDDEALRRILNTPPRGIGGTSMARIQEYAQLRNMPILAVLREIETDDTLSPRARRAATEFVHMIDDLALEAKTRPVSWCVKTLIEKINYRGYVQSDDQKETKNRLEIIEEFLNSCSNFDNDQNQNLQDFLQSMALVNDVDEYNAENPAISLMTCHSAKGLEFNHVYLIGLEEGLLPLNFDFAPDSELEEERRLCYVAMTRARIDLTLSAAQVRVLYNQNQDREISRFIREIGYDRLHMLHTRSEKRGRGNTSPNRSNDTGFVKSPVQEAYAEKGMMSGKSGTGVSTKGINTVTTPGILRIGTRVRHAKFGIGTIQYTSGSGDKLKARIRFSTGRSAMILVKMAPLELLDT